jgi:hypothetical protein
MVSLYGTPEAPEAERLDFPATIQLFQTCDAVPKSRSGKLEAPVVLTADCGQVAAIQC